MRWTRELRLTCAARAYGEVVWFGRRGAGVKRAIRSAGDGGKRAVLREEHEVSRKAIAQGRPECSRCPVCSCAILFAQIARETAGAASTRSSLRPLIGEGRSSPANLGRNASRDRETISTSLRAQRSNPSLRLPRYGLLRGACHPAALRADRVARNDGEGNGAQSELPDRRNQCSPAFLAKA
ncbi:hypothetical protein V1286_001501 [Bradyrhizobium algeriense]|uniref:Uncharacterized protein n=1 Tax=Bradyrhizobium algeriense TaxID=634784 RepID=A0ABU8B752_9BRAD